MFIVLVAVWAILATLALMFSVGSSKLRKAEQEDLDHLAVWKDVLS